MDHPSRPLVSVIIPAYNAEKTIHQAIESVLNQGIASCEILVIDDGSTDRTSAILQKFSSDQRLRILRHPAGVNRGVCASRKLALGEAQGEFIAFLDADDRYLPGKLQRHLNLLQEHPEIVLVHSAVAWKGPQPDHPGMALAFKLSENDRTYRLSEEPYFLRSNIICNSTVVTRRNAIHWQTLPDAMVYQSEDWVLWNIIAPRGLFFYDSNPLSEYFFHSDSYTSQSLKRGLTEDLFLIEFYLIMISRLPKAWMQIRAAKMLLDAVVTMAENRANVGAEFRTPPESSRSDSIARIIVLGFFIQSIKVLLKSMSLVRGLVRNARKNIHAKTSC